MNEFVSTFMHCIEVFVFSYPLLMSITWSLGGLFYWKFNEEKDEVISNIKDWPDLTIIVPCFNEEDVIENICHNLVCLDYPNYTVLFADDASEDKTRNIINEYMKKYDFINLMRSNTNQGKANAINSALKMIHTDLVMILDADTILDKKALKQSIINFIQDEKICAVTSNIIPYNKDSLLGSLQTLEYASIIGLLKRTQSIFGAIFTVSGCSTIYKTLQLKRVGGFSTDTATEDIDVTWKLHRIMKKIKYETNSNAYINVPNSLKDFIKQRKRWVLGGWHFLIQHSQIFKNLKLWRQWIVYFDFLTSYIWSFCFIGMLIYMCIQLITGSNEHDFVYLGLSGAILSFVFIVQSIIGTSICSIYDINIKKTLFTACLYPLFFFIIGPILIVTTSFEGLFKNSGNRNKWMSPKRIFRIK